MAAWVVVPDAAVAAAAGEASMAVAGQPAEPVNPQPGSYRADPLWLRVAAFDFDDADAQLPFSLRLARENGWSRYFALRVIEEYRRFCYLAVRTGHPVTPSIAVDQAWHLHLQYTRSYWDRFCPEVLHFRLHHGPTRGGAAEEGKFRLWYTQTVSSYEDVFGAPAPPDIWPSAAGPNSGCRPAADAQARRLPGPASVLATLRAGIAGFRAGLRDRR